MLLRGVFDSEGALLEVDYQLHGEAALLLSVDVGFNSLLQRHQDHPCVPGCVARPLCERVQIKLEKQEHLNLIRALHIVHEQQPWSHFVEHKLVGLLIAGASRVSGQRDLALPEEID